MEKLFNKCQLRRCQGQRGCICPKKLKASIEGESVEATTAGFAELMKAVNDVPLVGQEGLVAVGQPATKTTPTSPTGPQPSSTSFQKTSTTRLPKIATATTIDGESNNNSSTSNKEVPPTTAATTTTKQVLPDKEPTTTKLVPLAKKSSGKVAGETPKTMSAVTTVAEETVVVPAAMTEEESPLINGNGKVTIRFNHYKKQFDIIDGSMKAKTIDAEYYITFAFPGAKIHLTSYGPSDFSYEEKGFTSPPIELEKPIGTFQRLEADKIYYVQVEEESKAKQEYEERQEKKAAENAKKRAQQEAAEADGMIITKTKLESCSCIEGNPCLDKDCCKDWNNRFEVAKKFGWKGF